MKLLFCNVCHDVVKLTFDGRYCACKKSWGKYLPDGLYAQISGEAIPIGFANNTLLEALCKRPQAGDGSRFTAFVIPHVCPTIETVEHKN
jgi:hypothetical protein